MFGWLLFSPPPSTHMTTNHNCPHNERNDAHNDHWQWQTTTAHKQKQPQTATMTTNHHHHQKQLSATMSPPSPVAATTQHHQQLFTSITHHDNNVWQAMSQAKWGVVPTIYIINLRHLPAQWFLYCQMKLWYEISHSGLAALFSLSIFHCYLISISLLFHSYFIAISLWYHSYFILFWGHISLLFHSCFFVISFFPESIFLCHFISMSSKVSLTHPSHSRHKFEGEMAGVCMDILQGPCSIFSLRNYIQRRAGEAKKYSRCTF